MSPIRNSNGTTFPRTRTQGVENPGTTPLWADNGTQPVLGDDRGSGLRLPYSLDESTPSDTMMPDDIERMLDSINFPADIGLLWDYTPFGDVEPGFEDQPTGIDDTPYNENPRPNDSDMPRSPVSSSREPEKGKTVIIRPEDQEPIEHYLSTMVKFAKIRSSASDNIYCYIFTKMGLTHAPLYEAIIAWAALHLAHVKSSSTSNAEARYRRAVRLLYDDARTAEHVDLTLVTVWILLQYELFVAKGVDGFISLLNYVADVVEGIFERNSLDAVKEQLGTVGLRVLMWLAAYDSRAAPYGNPCRLLRCLKMHSAIYNDVDTRSKGSTHPVEFGTAESRACLRLALRFHILRGSGNILRHRQSENNSEQESAWTVFRRSLQEMREEVENSNSAASKLAMRVVNRDMDVPTTINAIEYNWMQLFATYHSIIIIYLQGYPQLKEDPEDERSWPSVEECAARIIRLSRQVTLSHPNSPQAIWPQILFVAGIYTDDPIYQSWVLAAFAQAEPWGPNMRKTRHLLERISKYPREVKSRLDIIALMDDLGGTFIV